MSTPPADSRPAARPPTAAGRRALRLSAVAVAVPAIALAWLGVRAVAAERAALRREAQERAQIARADVARHADGLFADLERGIARALDARGEQARAGALEGLASATPLLASVHLADAEGRFVIPRDRPAPPAAASETDPLELDQWREIADTADRLLARGTAPDAVLAAQLLSASAETFSDADMRAALHRRLADALIALGDADRAVALLEGVLADPRTRAAREPLGGPIGPTAAFRLAALHDRAGRVEAAVFVLAELVADTVAGSLRLADAEREPTLDAARAQLTQIVPDRAAAVFAVARGEAERLLLLRDAVLPRARADADTDAPARPRRIVLAPAPGARMPRVFIAQEAADGAVAGAEVDAAALAAVLRTEADGLARAYGLRVALLDREGRPVADDDVPAAAGASAPPPGEGRYLAETVPQWRVVATPDPLLARATIGPWVTGGAIALALLVSVGAALLAARAVAREIELARLRQEFVESVTHELRTPITSVRALSEVLLAANGQLPAERVRLYHESIARESVRLAALVENVLRAARLERGAHALALEAVPPREVATEALETFSRLPEGKDREVALEVSGSAPATVRLDRAAAVQALLNLISNAAKYSPAPATIDVTIEALTAGGGVRFRVRDRGEGVAADARAHLFEPFFRARPDDPTRPGTGLGLRVTRGLARSHGGDVRHEEPTDAGGGSVFVLELPSQSAEWSAQLMTPNETRPRVLVVEDEPPIAMALEDGLRLEGFEVEVANDGAKGLARASAEPAPDLVLLDLRLPGLPGLDVLRRLREQGARLPVIILTARGAEADRVAGLECGADDYVTKPFSMPELVARVRANLRRDREYARPAGEASDGGAADAAPAEETASFGDIEVDFAGHRATKGGRDLALSPLEMKIIHLLWSERGRTVSRERFLREVWGYEHLPVTRTVDFHVGRLRAKVEDDARKPRWIKTHHGVGYRLEA